MATARRLPLYWRTLTELRRAGQQRVASEEMSRLLGLSSATVRRDFWMLGVSGRRGAGFPIGDLIALIESALGATEEWAVAIAGAGALGTALAQYGNFTGRGFSIVALFDIDTQRVGQVVADVPVLDVRRIDEECRRLGVQIGVITTPAHAAQTIASAFADAGVVGILNFAPTPIQVPPKIHVRAVDMLQELQVLTFLATQDWAT